VTWREREPLLLLYWILVPLAIFFAARSRLELYVLPLFVPLAIVLARALAGWSWLTLGRLAITATITAVALVGIKWTAAHWASDRDARAMAAAIEKIIDPHDVDEIAFVDMRAFHGLQLYLCQHRERPGRRACSSTSDSSPRTSAPGRARNSVYAVAAEAVQAPRGCLAG
jgi:hypothetical protein